MSAKRKRPTIRDVAIRAGVSTATVSRVLNETDYASQSTAASVRSAIDAIGFRYNFIGRQLKTARSHLIGVLVPDLGNPVFAESVHGIQKACDSRGYKVILAHSEYSKQKEASAVDTLLSNRVDGLIMTITNAMDCPIFPVLEEEGVPFALIHNHSDSEVFSSVTINNIEASGEIVNWLISLGHTRIAMIAGSFWSSDRSSMRREGFYRAMAKHGLPPGEILEIGFDEFNDIHLSRRLAELLEQNPDITALFCSNDLLALAVIGGLRRLDLSVPADISVVGFDGISIGSWVNPKLSTVVQPTEEMGAQAATHVIDRITEGKPPVHLTLPHRLERGESTGPAPASSRVPEKVAQTS